jgi:positive phototaxis protein PixI
MSEFLPLPDFQKSALDPSETGPASTHASEQFLRLRLAADIRVLLPIQHLTEVLTISEGQIIPISHMPAWVMGVYNWRGEILWMVDLGHLCGLAPWYQQSASRSAHSAVVLNVVDSSATASAKGEVLGLVVSQVEDIEWCHRDEIQALSSTPIKPELERFAGGYWQQSEHETLVILDSSAILNRMPK